MNNVIFSGKVESDLILKTNQYGKNYTSFKLIIENSSTEGKESHPYITVGDSIAAMCVKELRKDNDVLVYCEYRDSKYGGNFSLQKLEKFVGNKKNNIYIP